VGKPPSKYLYRCCISSFLRDAIADKINERGSIDRFQAVVVADERTLARYLSKEETPASCGGSCSHDQLEWVEFFKQAEPFLASCKAAGRSLLSALSQLRNDDVPHQVTRRFLSHQCRSVYLILSRVNSPVHDSVASIMNDESNRLPCRQITKALDLEHVHKLRRDGSGTLSNLKERSQWLAGSRDVKRNVSFSEASFNSVERVSRRLEQLKQERAERLKELARFNTLKEEAEEVSLLWEFPFPRTERPKQYPLYVVCSIFDLSEPANSPGVVRCASLVLAFSQNASQQLHCSRVVMATCTCASQTRWNEVNAT
jgi:hypothetical protein